MSFERCTICGEYGWTDTHKCKPIFCVWYPGWHGDDPEDATKIHATDHAEAAATWAERDDAEGDYTIVSGSDVLVRVWRDDEEPSEAKTLVVTGESVPSYRAIECDEERFKKGSY
jgi:hypothetical protein